MSRKSEVIMLGEEGANEIYYASVLRPNKPNQNGSSYTLDVAEQAVVKFIQNNPQYIIAENNQVIAVIDSYERSDDQIILKSIVKKDSIGGTIAYSIVQNNRLKFYYNTIADYKLNEADNTIIDEITINRISIGAYVR